MRLASFGAIFALCSVAWALTPGEVYKSAGPAVVLILASDDGQTGSGGTGSIITASGKIITNAHVVVNAEGKPYQILYVFLKPAKLTGDNSKDLVNRYKASVVSFSPAGELDLALLQLENPPPNLPTISFADPEAVEIGQQAIAIGHPEQGGLWTLTTGAVSTVIANFGGVKGKDVFQTEASVNRGNSGGPLLDEQGNMLGINTMIARKGAGGVTITDVNFALKASVAVKWLAGGGLGLAYARPQDKQLVVAVAPRAAEGATPVNATKPITEPPPETVVVRQAPPAKPAELRAEGEKIGKEKSDEKLTSGKRLDVKDAKPTYHTDKRPLDLDELRRQQMKELEAIMGEGHDKAKGKKKNQGMGLW